MKEHKHSFNLGFLNYTIEVIFTDNLKASRASYDTEIGDKAGNLDGAIGLHSWNDKEFDTVSFIFLGPKSNTGTIAHEAFHAVCRVGKVFDIPLKQSSEEVYAYMLDFIISEILRFKQRIKK